MNPSLSDVLNRLSTAEKAQVVRDLLPEVLGGMESPRAILGRGKEVLAYIVPPDVYARLDPPSAAYEAELEESLQSGICDQTARDLIDSLKASR